jgi:hypothetical protein
VAERIAKRTIVRQTTHPRDSRPNIPTAELESFARAEEAKGDKVYGPNAPTAGSPPYTIFRIVPSRAYGLPGMFGMEQFDQADLPRPTRWDFGAR